MPSWFLEITLIGVAIIVLLFLIGFVESSGRRKTARKDKKECEDIGGK